MIPSQPLSCGALMMSVTLSEPPFLHLQHGEQQGTLHASVLRHGRDSPGRASEVWWGPRACVKPVSNRSVPACPSGSLTPRFLGLPQSQVFPDPGARPSLGQCSEILPIPSSTAGPLGFLLAPQPTFAVLLSHLRKGFPFPCLRPAPQPRASAPTCPHPFCLLPGPPHRPGRQQAPSESTLSAWPASGESLLQMTNLLLAAQPNSLGRVPPGCPLVSITPATCHLLWPQEAPKSTQQSLALAPREGAL